MQQINHQDVNDPVENKMPRVENKVVENASFGTYSKPAEDISTEKSGVLPDDGKNVPKKSAPAAQNEENIPAVEAAQETTEDVTAPQTSADGITHSADAAYVSPDAFCDEPIAVKGGARSVNPDILKQYTVEFPETMGYASVTVYRKNENIENAFLNQKGVLMSDKSVILSGDETDKFAMVKLQDAYAEIYAQNISDQELADVIANISL